MVVSKPIVVAQNPKRSVTIVKRKESPKKVAALRSVSTIKKPKIKSPIKVVKRKREVKAARKTEIKIAKVKRSVSVFVNPKSKSMAKPIKIQKK